MADASTNGPGATDRPLIAAQPRQTSAPTSLRGEEPLGPVVEGLLPGSCRLTPPTGGVTKEPCGTTSAGMTYFVFTGLVRPSGGSSGDDE